MNALELVRLALSRIGAGRLRAALTMLGIVIGVASVVALVSVGQGATSGVTAQLQGLGTNLVTVNPGAVTTGGTRGAGGSAATLTLEDSDAIGSIQGVAAVAPQVSVQKLVVAGTKNTTTTIIGTTRSYAAVRDYTIWQGAFLSDVAVSQSLRVAVLGATTADDLGLGPSDIGGRIEVAGLPFTLVGILQPKGSAGFANQDDQVLVPISTARELFVSGDSVRSIGVSVASADQVDLVSADITSTLRIRHHTTPATDDFSITSQAQLLSTVGSVTGLLTTLLAGIASISLVVGGIGIMNIMLVSVRERTREIGVRKAIGARGIDILAQFLVEALTLSVIGGAVGTIIGVAVSALIANVAGWALVVNPLMVLIALAFSLAVGVVFGVWPARQAARLDPIVALRYE
ncbi:MAG TPA: ABC transporter permease [Candidatus Dormibacteraeota bacterium]|nr:ABC transporter permease [Candidatus Dormibacteraeota bacterium]